MNVYITRKHRTSNRTRKLCYRKDDHAMRPIYTVSPVSDVRSETQSVKNFEWPQLSNVPSDRLCGWF